MINGQATYTVRRCWTKADLHLGVRESDGMRFHHVPQNDVRFKAYELFMSGICHLIFLDHGGSPQIRDITV